MKRQFPTLYKLQSISNAFFFFNTQMKSRDKLCVGVELSEEYQHEMKLHINSSEALYIVSTVESLKEQQINWLNWVKL